MEFWSLVVGLALLCSLPAGLVLVGLLAHRPSSATWIHRHARTLAMCGALAWASIAIRNWFAPSEPSVYSVLVPVLALVCMVAFSVARFGQEPVRS